MGTEMNVGHMLTRRALLNPEKEGLVCEEIRRTFSQMNARANQLANAMTAMGIQRGDRVGVPKGSRTPVAGVKGRSPGPLDDGDNFE